VMESVRMVGEALEALKVAPTAASYLRSLTRDGHLPQQWLGRAIDDWSPVGVLVYCNGCETRTKVRFFSIRTKHRL
jgi:hypothetical protein